MRPLRLELRGLTAFRDEQVLDFSSLDLFALWGPTGSGKSSLLDALTYALYGEVERVGKHPAALISQGQTRLAVLLEFEVEGRRYRVARSTPRSGTSKALLERLEGDEWKSHGEGADKTREVTKTITSMIGLDYDAFTRSVLLPQGKFAEFLKGDKDERRRILTELLGLELFGRMAARAGEVARAAKASVEAQQNLIESRYAAVDEAAVQTADAAVKSARELVAKVAEVERQLEAMAKKWDDQERAADSMLDCADEVTELAKSLTQHAGDLEALAERAATAEQVVKDAKADHKSTEAALTKIESAHTKLQAKIGTLDELFELRDQVRAHVDAVAEVEAAGKALAGTEAAVGKAQQEIAAAKKRLDEAAARASEAAHQVVELEVALNRAQRDDLVGALVKDLHTGDPCPVCERPLEHIKPTSPKALADADRKLVAARAAQTAAEKAQSEAAATAAVATAAVKEKKSALTERTKTLAAREGQVAKLAAAIGKGFGTKLPPDPAAEVKDRLAAMNRSAKELDDARSRSRETAEKLRTQETGAAEIASEVATIRAAIEAARLDSVVRQARKASEEIKATPSLPTPLPQDAPTLGGAAQDAAKSLEQLDEELRSGADRARSGHGKLLAEAFGAIDRAVGKIEIEADGVPELLKSFKEVRQTLSDEAVAAAEAAKTIRNDLAARVSIEADIAKQKSSHSTYGTLAYELRSDRLIAHLQEEALVVLAAAGSDRLDYLSGGRYKLAFHGDEFFVVDGWNGEEERSVRTLSGGETFLASLALALALSEQVRNLSVSRRAPLESLFLDEGFDQLDAELLETVVSAIEQLGDDGRLIGIVTHVSELADRLPVKIEIEKSPRGSHIRMADNVQV